VAKTPKKVNQKGKAFIAEVMRRVGAENGPQLAKMLYGGRVTLTQQRRVSAWMAGEGAPNMQSTLDLLKLAGLLIEDAGPVSRQARVLDDASVANAIEELAELLARQRVVLERLLRHEDEREQSQPAAAIQKKQTRRRKRA
jgi:hypothetical protein